MDVPTAFLYGDLDIDVYIKSPRGVNVKEGTFLKLNKAPYGLRESPSKWNECFDSSMHEQGLHAKGIVHELCGETVIPVLKCDNQSAIKLVESYQNYKRAKHIEIKFHLIKDVVAKKEMKIDFVKSEENVADVLTKPLCHVKFQILRNLMKIV